MRRIECIDGLDYEKVQFRHELTNLIRHETKSRVDYIHSIDINGVYYIINYVVANSHIRYSTEHSAAAEKIREFTRVEERNDKLIELGI